jgi:hypothetical protein
MHLCLGPEKRIGDRMRESFESGKLNRAQARSVRRGLVVSGRRLEEPVESEARFSSSHALS